ERERRGPTLWLGDRPRHREPIRRREPRGRPEGDPARRADQGARDLQSEDPAPPGGRLRGEGLGRQGRRAWLGPGGEDQRRGRGGGGGGLIRAGSSPLVASAGARAGGSSRSHSLVPIEIRPGGRRGGGATTPTQPRGGAEPPRRDS